MTVFAPAPGRSATGALPSAGTPTGAPTRAPSSSRTSAVTRISARPAVGTARTGNRRTPAPTLTV